MVRLSRSGRSAAGLVAAGILASRLVGLVRQKVIAHYVGQSTVAADALAAAFRIPNVLQNLLGEGVLSASFIPEYARLRSQGNEAEAERLAGAMLGFLGVIVSVIVAVGVTSAPFLVGVLVPGFTGHRRALAVSLVRILFPGVGLLVLSAWCLGVLNSHRRFFLSYAAPVVWNLAIIGATIVGAMGRGPDGIVRWTVWGAVIGSGLQFLVQLPAVIQVAGRLRPTFRTPPPSFQAVRTNLVPAFIARGVVQISAFLDAWIASWLPLGAVAALSNAQLLYTLPISLFGMSVAAAELPAMAEESVGAGRDAALRDRLVAGARRVAFFVVPTAVLFLLLGHQVAGLVFQSGAFTAADSRWVWGTLAASTIGLLPQAWGRLLSSAHYALGDTRTPFRFAALRVGLAIAVGALLAFRGPVLLGVDPKWGTAGLALGTALAGTLEWWLLRRSMVRRLGPTGLPISLVVRLVVAALAGGGAAWAALGAVAGPAVAGALLVLIVYGLVFLLIARVLRIAELGLLHRRLAP